MGSSPVQGALRIGRFRLVFTLYSDIVCSLVLSLMILVKLDHWELLL